MSISAAKASLSAVGTLSRGALNTASQIAATLIGRSYDALHAGGAVSPGPFLRLPWLVTSASSPPPIDMQPCMAAGFSRSDYSSLCILWIVYMKIWCFLVP